MNCLVVGYGSIGKRHAEILIKIGCRVAVVSRRDISFPTTYSNLTKALAKEEPDYVILANETSRHYASLVELTNYGFKGVVLVEKPLFHRVGRIPINSFKGAYVGYNMRFHPILQKVFEITREERILYCQVYVGQYLPSWRPGQDYWRNYSAERNEGGGVLLDLSHELDYLQWLFEDWYSIVAMGGKYSSLQINSDDMYSLMLCMKKCPMVQVHLNYLDRISRRELTVITDTYSIKADFTGQMLQINEKLIEYDLNRNDTYYMQHKAIIDGESRFLCTLTEGLKTLEMVEMAEKSVRERKWMDK